MPTVKAQGPTVEDDDETLLVGLIVGSPTEQQQSFDAIFYKYKHRVAGFALRCAPGLSPEDIASVTHDTFRGLHKRAAEGKLDSTRPLLPLLFTIAKARAADALRHMLSKKGQLINRLRTDDEFAEVVAKHISGTDVGFEWKLAVSEQRASELMELFRQFIPSLPPVQQQVARIIGNALPGDLTDQEIANEIFLQTGNRPTIAQVRSAWKQMEIKFRALLAKRENK